MGKQSIEEGLPSRVCFEELESFVRGRVQQFVQDLLEEEVTELLGREKSERRAEVDSPAGYRNGHGKPRRLTMQSGTVTVRRPRVRGLEERFESRILPMFSRRTKEVGDLLPELYLHGLAQGDFDLALRGLLGAEAPLSASTVARLKAKWDAEYTVWKQRSLVDREVVYLWVDGLYVKAGLEKEKAALLVVLAVLSDGHKEFLCIQSGYRESTESWAGVLRELKRRGLKCPRLVIGDGHLGIWGALRDVYPEADEQRCWNHRILNVLNKVPKKQQVQARLFLKQIPYADTLKEAKQLKKKFQDWCQTKGLSQAGDLLDKDWERMVAFYRYPKPHWQHIRTTNPVESPFSAVRLRTNAARRFKKVENATAVIWKTLMVAQMRFRKLKAPALLKDVFRGVQYADGEEVIQTVRKEAA